MATPDQWAMVRDAERVVVSRAVEFVQACSHHVFTIMEYGEGEAELHRLELEQVEEGLVTAVADLLAARTQGDILPD